MTALSQEITKIKGWNLTKTPENGQSCMPSKNNDEF